MDKQFRKPKPPASQIVLVLILSVPFLIFMSWQIKAGLISQKSLWYFKRKLLFIAAILIPLAFISKRSRGLLLSVKGDVFYVHFRGLGFFYRNDDSRFHLYPKPKKFPLADVDYIKIIRWQGLGIVSNNYYNDLVIVIKNGKPYETRLPLTTEKDCKALDAFLQDALPNVKIEKEFHHWKENWS